MTEIVVARRDGVLTAPDGVKYRLYRGKTMADARHPAAVAHPDSFAPIQIELNVADTDPEQLDIPAAPDPLAAQLADAEATLADYRAQLEAVASALEVNGFGALLPDERHPGWLAAAVEASLVSMRSRSLSTVDPDEDPVPPPVRPARRRSGNG